MSRKTLVFFGSVMILSIMISSAVAGEPGTLKPEGKAYFYYLHDASEYDGQSNSFDLGRMYIGAKYFVDEDFTIRYLTDIGHESGGGKFEVFAKYAYLDWKMTDKLNVVMGLQGTNNWSAPEKAWGYRQIRYSTTESFGKFWGGPASDYKDYLTAWAADATATPAEQAAAAQNAANFAIAKRSKMGSSADLGISLKYKPSSKTYVNVMVRNGLGYKKVEDDMYKNFQFRTGTYLMDKAVHVSAMVEVEPWKGVDEDGAATGYMNLQWDFLVDYSKKDVFSIGVAAGSKTFAGIEEITASSIGVFGDAFIIPGKLKALARYDMYTTGFNDVDLRDGEAAWETNGGMIIVGCDYYAHKKVHIIPNIQITTYENSDIDSDVSAFLHVYFKI
jgi:hypothetical protein